MNAQAGGFLATPPGLDGDSGLGIPGVSGAPRPNAWDAVAIGEAPGLTGDEVHFVTLEDGSIVVEEDVPDGTLDPLAEAVEKELARPYEAEAARQDGDVWGVGANSAEVATLPAEIAGDQIELSRYEGATTCLVDGRPQAALPELLAVGERYGDEFSLTARRLDDTTWVVRADPL
jgi:hypothetical protein